VAGRGGDAEAAERRLAEALGAQASLAAAPAPVSQGSTGSTRVPQPGSTGATRPPQPGSTGVTRPSQPGSTGATRSAPPPGGPRLGAPISAIRRREAAPIGPSAGAVPARSGAGSPTADGAARLHRALLVALLAGVLLGCALALLSVLVPGLLPALG
jgi:hypothetical protein